MENNSANNGSALLKNYARYSVDFDHGEGIYLYDKDGKKYLDFFSGIAVTGFGHKHPELTKVAHEQIDKLWHISNVFDSSLQKSLAEKLVAKCGLDNAFFCNSGTEANEAAIKFARRWGKGRYKIASALNGFHGRTLGSLAATGQYKLWEGFYPMPEGFCYFPYGDVEALERIYTPDMVAVIVEPIQGEGGIIVPREGFLKELRAFCTKYNLLLILDEVQAGMGRTGKFFAHQYEDIKPDIITCAKGIANGIPLGAVICTKEVGDEMKPGSHGTTFGGNPIAVAVANKVMDLLDDRQLEYNALMGEKLRDVIKTAGVGKIKEVRGKGLLIGVEMNDGISAKKVAAELLKNGIVVGTSGEKALRVLPPFVVTDENIQSFAECFGRVISSM